MSSRALLNTGKLGYLVDVATGTATGTLYDALVGGGSSYSNVIFDSRLDGSTVSVSGTTAKPASMLIDGNGEVNTIITGASNVLSNTADSQDNSVYRNLTFKNFGYQVIGTFINCTIDGNANGTNYHTYLGAFENCTIKNVTQKEILASNGNSSWFKNCVVENNTRSILTMGYRANLLIKGSIFCNNAVVAGTQYWGLIRFLNCSNNCRVEDCLYSNPDTPDGQHVLGIFGSTVTISGSTFATAADNILVVNSNNITDSSVIFEGTNIINSTVSGSGTVIFADGATVSSTIPLGSTIGTGTFNMPNAITYGSAFRSGLVENVTVTGSTSKPFTLEYESGNPSRRMVFKNVFFDMTGSHNLSVSYPADTYVVDTCRGGACYYAYAGTVYIKDSSSLVYFNAFKGTLVISGICSTPYILISDLNSGSDVTNTTIWLMDGLTLTCTDSHRVITRITLGGACHVYVGHYAADGVTPVLGGTATIIVNGSTYHVTGEGTYFDLNATPITDLTIVS